MKSLKEIYNQFNEKFESFWNEKIESKIPENISNFIIKVKEKTDIMPLLLAIFVVGIYLFLNPHVNNANTEQNITELYNLTIVVYNFNDPLENASVSIYTKNKKYDSGITDSNGIVTFRNLKRGSYLIVVSYENVTKNQSVYIRKNEKMVFNFEINKTLTLVENKIIKVLYQNGKKVNQIDKLIIIFKDGTKKTFEYVSGEINLKNILDSLGDLYSINDIDQIYVFKGDCSATIIDPLHQSDVYLECQNNTANNGKYDLHLSIFDSETGMPISNIKVLLFLSDGGVIVKNTDNVGRVIFRLSYGTKIEKIKIPSNGKYEGKEIKIAGTVEDDDKVLDNNGNNVWPAAITLLKIEDREYNKESLRIVDEHGNPLKNHLVFVEMNGKNYTYITDEYGYIDFVPPENGKYKIIIPGDENHPKVVVDQDDVNDGEIIVNTTEDSENKVCVFVKLNGNYVDGANVTIGNNDYIGETENGKFCFVSDGKEYEVFVKYIKDKSIYESSGYIKSKNITIILKKLYFVNKLTVNLKYNGDPVKGYVFVYSGDYLVSAKDCENSCEFILKSNENYKIEAFYPEKDIHVFRTIDKLTKDTVLNIDFYVDENENKKIFILKDTRGNYLKNKEFNVTIYDRSYKSYSVELITNDEGKALLEIPNNTKKIRVYVPADTEHKEFKKTIYDLTNKTFVFVLEYKEPNTCIVAKLENGTQVAADLFINSKRYKTYKDKPFCFYLERSAKVQLTYVDKFYYERIKTIYPGRNYIITLEKSDKVVSNAIIYTKYNGTLVNSTAVIDGKTFECSNGVCNITLPVGKYNIELRYWKGMKKYILNKEIKIIFNKTNKYYFDFYEIDDKKRINFVLNILNYKDVKNIKFDLKVYCEKNILLEEKTKLKQKMRFHLDLTNKTECNLDVVLIGLSEESYYIYYGNDLEFDYNKLNEYNVTLSKYNKTEIVFRTYLKYKNGKVIPVNPDWYEIKSNCYYNKQYTNKTEIKVTVPICGKYTIRAYRKGEEKELKLEYDNEIRKYTSDDPKNGIYFDPVKYFVCLNYYYVWDEGKLDKDKLKVVINKDSIVGKWVKEYKQCFNLEELKNYDIEIYLDNLYGSKIISSLDSNKTFFVTLNNENDYKYIVLKNVDRSVFVKPNKIKIKYDNLANVIDLEIHLKDKSTKLIITNISGFEILGLKGNCNYSNVSNSKGIVIYNCSSNPTNGKLYIKINGIKIKNISFDYFFETPVGSTNSTHINISIEFDNEGLVCIGNEKYVCYKGGSLDVTGKKINGVYLNNVILKGNVDVKYNNTKYELIIYNEKESKVASNKSNVVFANVSGSGNYILNISCENEEKTVDSKKIKITELKTIDIVPYELYTMKGGSFEINGFCVDAKKLNLSKEIEIEGILNVKENPEKKEDWYCFNCLNNNCILNTTIYIINGGKYYTGKINLINLGNCDSISITCYSDSCVLENADNLINKGFELELIKTSDLYCKDVSLDNKSKKVIKNCDGLNKSKSANITFIKLFKYNGNNIGVDESLRCSNIKISSENISYKAIKTNRFYFLRLYEAKDIIENAITEKGFNVSYFYKEVKTGDNSKEEYPMMWSSQDIVIFVSEFYKLIKDKYNISEDLLENITKCKNPIDKLSDVVLAEEYKCGGKNNNCYCQAKLGKFEIITGLGDAFDNLKDYINKNIKDKIVFKGDGINGLDAGTKYNVTVYLNYSNSNVPYLVLEFKKEGDSELFYSNITKMHEFLLFFDKMYLASFDKYTENHQDEKNNIVKSLNYSIKNGIAIKLNNSYLTDLTTLKNNKITFASSGGIYFVHRYIKDKNDYNYENYIPIVWFMDNSENSKNYCENNNVDNVVEQSLLCSLRNVKLNGKTLWKAIFENWNNKYRSYSKRTILIFGIYKNSYPYILWIGNDVLKPGAFWEALDTIDKEINDAKIKCDGKEYHIDKSEDNLIELNINISCGNISDNMFYLTVVNLNSKQQGNDQEGENQNNENNENQKTACKINIGDKTYTWNGDCSNYKVGEILCLKIENNNVYIKNLKGESCSSSCEKYNITKKEAKDNTITITLKKVEESSDKTSSKISLGKVSTIKIDDKEYNVKLWKENNSYYIFNVTGSSDIDKIYISKDLNNYDIVCENEIVKKTIQQNVIYSIPTYTIDIIFSTISKKEDNDNCDNKFFVVLNDSTLNFYNANPGAWKITIEQDTKNKVYDDTLTFETNNLIPGKEYIFFDGGLFTDDKIYNCSLIYGTNNCIDALTEKVGAKSQSAVIIITKIDPKNKIIYAKVNNVVLAGISKVYYNNKETTLCEENKQIVLSKGQILYLEKNTKYEYTNGYGYEIECISLSNKKDDKHKIEVVVNDIKFDGDIYKKIIYLTSK